MADKVRVASTNDVPPGSGKEFAAAGRVVALFNVDGQFYALDGVCPHAGGPLGQGDLSGATVTCPWHGWQFDVRSGQHQASTSLRHTSFPVKVEGDEILVDMDA